MTFEQFELLFGRELKKIPLRFKQGVLGFHVEKRTVRYYPTVAGLYILGKYQPDNGYLGPAITLYYGSFMKVCRGLSFKEIQVEIAKTIAHELLHHWENLAGRNLLMEKDLKKLARWKRQLGFSTKDRMGRDLREVILFLYMLFLSLAFVTRLAE
ncbi:metallopeptidase family protein [bacterium]|nr:metallopeptidase family protein [bacterium]